MIVPLFENYGVRGCIGNGGGSLEEKAGMSVQQPASSFRLGFELGAFSQAGCWLLESGR
jgi:hypothetical protein